MIVRSPPAGPYVDNGTVTSTPFSLTCVAPAHNGPTAPSYAVLGASLTLESAPAPSVLPNPEPGGGVLFGVGSLLVAAALRRRGD